MKIDVITLFPEFVEQVIKVGIPRKAVDSGALQFHARDLRDYSDGADRRVDDRPYGGGPGMVMEPGPLADAIAAAKAGCGSAAKRRPPKELQRHAAQQQRPQAGTQAPQGPTWG